MNSEQSLIEDAFTIEELELLDDMTDPILNHARVEDPEKVRRLHIRVSTALKRARFHQKLTEPFSAVNLHPSIAIVGDYPELTFFQRGAIVETARHLQSLLDAAYCGYLEINLEVNKPSEPKV